MEKSVLESQAFTRLWNLEHRQIGCIETNKEKDRTMQKKNFNGFHVIIDFHFS